VATGTVASRPNVWSGVHWQFEVQTLKGSVNLEFPQWSGVDAIRFQKEIASALDRHATGERDIRAVIWSLSLGSTEKRLTEKSSEKEWLDWLNLSGKNDSTKK